MECVSSPRIANEPDQTDAEGDSLDQFADGLDRSDRAQDAYGWLEGASPSVGPSGK